MDFSRITLLYYAKQMHWLCISDKYLYRCNIRVNGRKRGERYVIKISLPRIPCIKREESAYDVFEEFREK